MGFDMEAYTEIIKENIELDILLERYPYDRELLIGIFDLILETVLCKNKSIMLHLANIRRNWSEVNF